MPTLNCERVEVYYIDCQSLNGRSQIHYICCVIPIGSFVTLVLVNYALQGSLSILNKKMTSEFGWNRATSILPMTLDIFLSCLPLLFGRLLDVHEYSHVVYIDMMTLALRSSITWIPST